jgi:hypothetical protein
MCSSCILAAGGWYAAAGVRGFPEGCAYNNGTSNATTVITKGYRCTCVKGVSIYDDGDSMGNALWKSNVGKACACAKGCLCRVKHTIPATSDWGIDMMVVGWAKKVRRHRGKEPGLRTFYVVRLAQIGS